MLDKKDQKSLRFFATIVFLIFTITYLITIYAKGYRINLKEGINFNATGILSVTSKPKTASVYINGHLVSATDDTINLPPGEYDIKIVKDGFTPWQKHIILKKETVVQTDAHLFRIIPDIRAITLTGAINPSLSPDGSRIIYAVASASASKNNGLYQYDLTSNILPLNKNQSKQISNNLYNIDWSKFKFTFSPDGKELLASSVNTNLSYLINLDDAITLSKLKDVTLSKTIIMDSWKNTENNQIIENLKKLPIVFKNFISTSSAKLSSFSLSDDKFLYLAQSDFLLDQNIVSPPPGQSTQAQNRQIKKGFYYVYDLKDDTNFLIGTGSEIGSPFWLSGSNSIVFNQNNTIKAIDYDGTNIHTFYSDKFDGNFVAAKTDGNELIILRDNLFALNIR